MSKGDSNNGESQINLIVQHDNQIGILEQFKKFTMTRLTPHDNALVENILERFNKMHEESLNLAGESTELDHEGGV